ncbi:MAG: hypothetical protein EA417_00125 [Gammaproteobacteria bacterium]|nr:MAG: hypothetical protein EA417_00125 [Gammaproteobacteria bacterium]
MPLPLIPVVIALATAGTGGVAAGADGVRRMSKAHSKQARAGHQRQVAIADLQAAWGRADVRAGSYGQFQLHIERDTIGDWARWLAENDRKVRCLEGAFVEGVHAEPIDLPALQAQAFEAEQLLGGGLGAALTGFAARQAALTGVRALATASTGTAVSGLSGAAANSATLAWLGGGTLATGGGGMAAGATVLAAVGIVPALLIGGLTLSAQGHRALTRARSVEASAAIDIAQLETKTATLGRIERRIDELHNVMQALDGRTQQRLTELRAVDFDPGQHVELFMQTAQLIQALREVLSTPVVTANGEVTVESELIVIKYKPSDQSLHTSPANCTSRSPS